ncbi:L-idonate 5-dehydrogenase [Georgenia thermotolerans]|uniref:Zinc-binding dehydrogenase n=1 Tax=Georgenia thermotolerans TaxID=527326 RepID=A0A7J5USR9_9MICO|nr:L-idonate 5-dehydrogenase [Georgenia thermotolerans]KAE8765505.1 zinc-binding dehydrogenase [Georgenia thermotolerans]
MKALTIHGKTDIREEEVPTPEPGEGQVRLRMAYAGICGSDLHYYFEGANGEYVVREPLVPGHEVSGTVDLDPSGELAPGTPVTVHPATFGTPEDGIEDRRHLWPGGSYLGSASTWPHTQGGMSEYLLVGKDMVRVLPAGLPLRRAALAEPLAVALHAINVAGGVEGKRVLVSGSGPIGLLAAAAALAKGATEVVATDVLAGPLERARALGVHGTVQVGIEEIPALAFDVVLECSGVPAAISPALVGARRAGIVVQVGMVPNEARPVNLAPLVSKELQLRGTFRFNDEIDEAVELLDANPSFERVITHDLPAGQAVEAFAAARDSAASGKVVVSLWQD